MRAKSHLVMLFISLLIGACNLGVKTTEAPPATAAPPTTAPAMDTAPVPATPTVVTHKIFPGEFPKEPSGSVGDQDSSVTAPEKRAPGGDRFTFSQFERPFNAQTMDMYYPQIDILEGSVFEDETWVYAALKLKGDEASRELNGRYGLELDLNLDGGGDWLILVSNPSSTDWTTDGVEVWFDTDDDVGGKVPTATDSAPVAENGYETLEFGAGVGDDPDFAWARVSSDDPSIVQFAIKKDILQGSKRFLAGFWSGNEDLDPSLFEYSDNFTHEQAGAALTELENFYPIKELSELDNTCRMAVGFQATGKEPGLCPLPLPPGAPESPLDPNCPAQSLVCRDQPNGGPPICVCTQP